MSLLHVYVQLTHRPQVPLRKPVGFHPLGVDPEPFGASQHLFFTCLDHEGRTPTLELRSCDACAVQAIFF